MVIRNDDEKAVLEDFAYAFSFCWACGTAIGMQRPWNGGILAAMEIHHIVKPGRKHERWNLARLCKVCHNAAENMRVRVKERWESSELVLVPQLTMANVLWLKKVFDAENYDRPAMRRQLMKHWMPNAIKPPSWFEKMYRQVHGVSWNGPLSER